MDAIQRLLALTLIHKLMQRDSAGFSGARLWSNHTIARLMLRLQAKLSTRIFRLNVDFLWASALSVRNFVFPRGDP